MTVKSFNQDDVEIYIVDKNDEIIGTLTAVSYTINRQAAPIYTIGRSYPGDFAPSKKTIGGSLTFGEIYDEAEGCKIFDIKMIATNDKGERVSMRVGDVQCLYEKPDDLERDQLTFIAQSIEGWKSI